ncbi:MAG: ABC transporter permease [Prevotellaceae bacterium]|jgi:ABC-2 type transport system permease protein|nr:ABC transporter permease [Prevotellaceae bacterium]
MRNIFIIVKKEIRQILRDKLMMLIIFVMPTLQLLILPLAATFEMKEIKMYVVDFDNSPTSRDLINKFSSSPFYNIVGSAYSHRQAEANIISNKADFVLEIPANMERELQTLGAAKVQFVVNAINGMVAGLINGYSTAIIADFNSEIRTELTGGKYTNQLRAPTYSYWFNPQLDYKTYMIPGILIMMVSIIGLFLTAMNMVREKEIGTIEQINVTPIRKYEFIIGKSLPFCLIGLVVLTLGLLLAMLIYDVPVLGSIWLIYGVAMVYLFAVLGIGLFISAISDTQQQAMFVAWFFVMIFILISGLFTPSESMPDWLKGINTVNPIYYGIKMIRMVMLKGASFYDILPELKAVAIYGVCAMSLAVRAYRKRV